MTDLLKLAERVEAATGLRRLETERLGWEIWIAVNAPEAKLEGNGSDRLWKVRLGGSPLGGGKIINSSDPPAYTASLDAAMTLAGDGFGSIMSGRFQRDGGPGCVAVVTKPARAEATARTAPLALTAAALRARAASETSNV